MQTKNKINPKIAVMGAGAIGSLTGGILAHSGKDVTLIGRGAHIDTINKKGLSVDGIKGSFTVKLQAATKLEFKPDVIFLAVKTQDVEESCKEIQQKAPGTPVVLMQNGIRSAEIAGGILNKDLLINCMLMLNARYLEPGMVSFVAEKPIVIGSAFKENTELLKKIQGLLNNITKTFISKNITGVQLTKLAINSMSNALDSMTGMSMGEYSKHPAMITLGVLILKEAFTILHKAQIKMESIPGTPVQLFKTIIKLPLPVPSLFLGAILRSGKDAGIITSTLQSLKRGKKTEIDYLNGEFVKLGNDLGISTPVNSKVVELIHKIEETGRFSSPDELAALFTINRDY